MSSEPALTRDDQEPLPWERPEETALFRGDLQDVGLNSLAQLAQAESLSGSIRVERRGEVGLSRGRITGASCGALRGIETAAAVESQDFGELVDRARGLARAGQLDAAEQALARALALRPGDRVVQQNLKALARRRASAGEVQS